MSNFFDIQGQKIRYSSSGVHSNGTILFIHGNSLSRKTFSDQLDKLDLPCVAIDLPGHGDSDKPADPARTYNAAGYAEIIAKFVEALDLNKVLLAGHSLGGHIAISTLPLLGKKVKGLALFGAPPLSSANDLAEAFLPNPNFPFLLSGEISEENANSLAGSMLFRNEMHNALADTIRKTDPNARVQFGTSVASGQVPDELSLIKKASIPVAVIHGEHDTFVDANYLKKIEINGLYKNAIQVIPDCGHCPQLEQPEKFNDIMRAYYRSVFA